jgi:hypothetical protein
VAVENKLENLFVCCLIQVRDFVEIQPPTILSAAVEANADDLFVCCSIQTPMRFCWNPATDKIVGGW